MNKHLATLLATTAALWGLAAHAASPAAPGASATLTSGQASNLKKESDAKYKAGKEQADANYELNKAKCETTTSGSVKSACKDDAKAEAKKEKADAKVENETQKSDIKAQTK